MKPFVGLNNAMLSVTMGAFLFGAQNIIKQNHENLIDFFSIPLLFFLFFFFLRIKIYIDDSFLLLKSEKDSRPYKQYGRFSSVVAWFFFILSAYNLTNQYAYWFFICAFFCSSTWVFLSLLQGGKVSTKDEVVRKEVTEHTIENGSTSEGSTQKLVIEKILKDRQNSENIDMKALCKSWLGINVLYIGLALFLIFGTSEILKFSSVLAFFPVLIFDYKKSGAWKNLGEID